jgi:hypothetical protein
MPGVLTLTTNLKSLRYGQDRPDGGSSNQPYIQTDINNPVTPLTAIVRNSAVRKLLGDKLANQITDTIGKVANIDDGFIRGGILGSTNASITDTIRISKFLTDVPRGPLFITRQVGLQLSNPRLEVKKYKLGSGGLKAALKDVFTGSGGNLLGSITGGLLEPTRIYNLGINTLAQVPVNALGGHIVRHGLLPINSEDTSYRKIVEFNNENGSNRLAGLAEKFKLGDGSFNIRPNDITREDKVKLRRENRAERRRVNANNKEAKRFAKDPSAQAINKALGIAIPSLEKFTKKKFDTTSSTIDNYIGGPGSIYGIGKTLIRRYEFTENAEKINESILNSIVYAGKTRDSKGDPQPFNYIAGIAELGDRSISSYGTGTEIPTDKADIDTGVFNFATLDPTANFKNSVIRTYSTIADQIEQQQSATNPARQYTTPGTTATQAQSYNTNQFGIYTTDRGDVTKLNKNSNYNTTDVSPIAYKNSYDEVYTVKVAANLNSWDNISREVRVGSFGKAKNYKGKELRAADSINLTPLFENNKYWADDKISINNIDYNIRDLVKFKIQVVDTDSPSNSTHMLFRAYLTQFNDSIDSTWNDISYVGRGNKFYVYNNFSRKVQLGFKVAALSAEEMQPMYSKLNYLMSSLTPDYKDSILRGALHRMTVGNYFDNQLGIINSLTYTIPNESPWEISLDEPEGGSKQLILPHILEVSLGFIPIGVETGGKSKNGNIFQLNKIEELSDSNSFLAQNTTGGDTKDIQYYNSFFNP